MKKFIYILLALLILFGVYLIGFSIYHSGEPEYMADPTTKI